jgi:hypothetical protein
MTTKKIILAALESPVIMGMVTLLVLYIGWAICVPIYGEICKFLDKMEKDKNLSE